MSKPAYFQCLCGHEMIMVECEQDWLQFPDEEIPYCIDFSIWHYGNKRLSWWRRMWACWHLIRTGYPWKDQITLGLDTARELGVTLTCMANEHSNPLQKLYGIMPDRVGETSEYHYKDFGGEVVS